MKTIIFVFLILVSVSAELYARDDQLFYQLGGGLPISAGATNRSTMHKIGGSISWNSDLTCGNFDINTSIKNQLNGVTGAFQNIMSSIIKTASGVVASLPALIIQKLNPALYDLLQNGILQASEEFHLGSLDCKKIVKDMGGKIAANGWGSLAKASSWTASSNSAGTDILSASKSAETAGLDNGVSWVDGKKRGGKGQGSIKVNKDTTNAGFNLLLQRSAGDTSTVTKAKCANAGICNTWKTPDEASKWLVSVVGDKEINTCQGCNKVKSIAGMGLQRQFEFEYDKVLPKLKTLVTSGKNPSAKQLSELQGAQGLTISRRVIEAMRDEETPSIMIQRLSSEIAVSRTMEKALFARRALLAGMKEPNVANNHIALEELEKTVYELNQEIENLVFEMDIRSRLASNTTVTLLQRSRQRGIVPVLESSSVLTIKDGAAK